MTDINEYDTELEQALQNHYQHIYGKPLAPERIWERVAPLLGPQEQQRPWWKQLLRIKKQPEIVPITNPAWRSVRKPSPRLAMALALLLALILLAGTAYAAIDPKVFGDLFEETGLQQLLQTNQFTDYHQSKSVDGYTLTIQKAYADANQVTIAYTVEVPPGGIHPFFKFGQGTPKLTTEQGVELSEMEGTTDDPIGGVNGTILIFNAASIQNNPHELHLRLMIPYSGKGKSPSLLSGYLTFNFTVPFHPGRIANLHQSVTAGGKTITLERVVVALSSVRVYISGFSPRDNILFSLSVGMQKCQDSPTTLDLSQKCHGYRGYEGPGVWYMDFAKPSTFDAHTQWTLVVHQIQFHITKEIKTTNGSILTKGTLQPFKGPLWTFHFVVS